MNPVLTAILTSWDWRLDVILVLGLAGIVFSRGWWQLRRRTGHRLAAGWRLGVYLGGLAVLALALMSPIDVLGTQLFYMHMIQHLLLVMIAAPLLLLANPLPFGLWGLPKKARSRLGMLLNRKSKFRHGLRAVTSRSIVWMVFMAVYLGWHDPNAYNAALRNDFIHDLEHITFFGAALLFWWHVIDAGPYLHGRPSYMARLLYLLSALPPNLIAGASITFATGVIYTYYTTVPRLGGITVMEDQMMGGVIMWIPGSMMFVVAAVILVIQMVRVSEQKQRLSEFNPASVGYTKSVSS